MPRIGHGGEIVPIIKTRKKRLWSPKDSAKITKVEEKKGGWARQ